jgi:REP element-mobilizing transposase RayT
MPRQARKKSISGIYHVIVRGVNQQNIFEDDGDRKRFLMTLQRFKEISGFEIYSYCLMDNHIHLVIMEAGESISVALKRINSSYVYWFNKKYNRIGHLFQERFKSEPVETKGYFMRVNRYIHQNPLKAGLAGNVFACKWTSMDEYVGQPRLVDVDRLLKVFSEDRGAAMKEFVAYMQVTDHEDCLEVDGKLKLPDSAVQEEMFRLGVASATALQQIEVGDRNEVLQKLKNLDGVSLRQVSRVTGISKSVVQRVWRGRSEDRSVVPSF